MDLNHLRKNVTEDQYKKNDMLRSVYIHRVVKTEQQNILHAFPLF